MKKNLCFILLSISTLCNAQKSSEPKESVFPLGITTTYYSKELSENRTLNIYLPPGYHPDSTTTYPVIYLLDGGADEDFIHIVGLVQHFSFPWIHKISPSIVVGIANIDRQKDFTLPSDATLDKKQFPTSGNAEKFIAFIGKELQPWIEKKYKANANKTLIGQSLGGLLATTILLQQPTLFNTYIIVSPSLWWNNGELLQKQGQAAEISKLKFQSQTNIYIGVGKEGTMPGREKLKMEDIARQLADNLKKGNNKGTQIFFDYLPGETHATVIHPAVYNAFKLIYP